MATLKATLNISSTDLFPIPVNFTETVIETIGGNRSSFMTKVLAAGASNIALYNAIAPGTGILYFYFKAAILNANTIDIEIVQGGNTVSALRLSPGDIAILPIDANVSTTVQADNNAVGAPATLQYFYGEKG